jgi:hypothetical protein
MIPIFMIHYNMTDILKDMILIGYLITANFLLDESILKIDNNIGYVSNLFKLRQKAAGLSHIL